MEVLPQLREEGEAMSMKLTAEQVREAIERNFDKVAVLDDGNPVEWRDDWVCNVGINYKAIADELNATLGSWTSSSEEDNPQVRCTDSGRNTLVQSREDSHTLLPCPFCGGEAHAYRNNLWHVGCEHAHNGCVTMSAFVTEAEAVAAWNTRACVQCEGGAVPMTDEAMEEHGWVRERTCRPSGEWKSISQTQEVRHVSCSECGHEFGMERRYTIPFERTLLVELPNFCPNCGAEVMDS